MLVGRVDAAMAPILDAVLSNGHNMGVGPLREGVESSDTPKTPFAMSDLLRPLSLAALWFAVIFALTALAFKMVRRFGGSSAGDQPETAELLTKFRDLHSRGGLSDEEYRTIKTKLAAQLEVPLNDAEQSS